MKLIIAGAVAIVILLVLLIVIRRRPRKLDVDKFQNKWNDLQSLCRKKDTWGEALIAADKLLEEALKRRHYNGKSMGERIVAAQRDFTNNDSLCVWSQTSQ